MNLTLLLDLDDTLLVNDIEVFLPSYLQALSQKLVGYAVPEELIANLLSATRRMIENRRPDCTLKQVFDAAFYPSLHLDPIDLQDEIEGFYTQIFPTLRGLTHQSPEAIRLVEQALERGYHLAVTTNPLFPRTAIEQRLTWAGLSPEEVPFELITSYESFHFTKPSAAFYAEVLGRLGWPDGPVLSIGDDLINDIAASRELGIPAFWINTKGVPDPEGLLAPTASGLMSDVLPWLDNQPEEALQPDYTSPTAMLAILRSTPAALHALCQDLTEKAWNTRTLPEEWCPTEILCHLRDVDQEVNLPRIRKLLEEDNPFLPGKDTDPWAKERKYICQNGPEALAQFTRARLELLDRLESMPPDGWQYTARHAIFGPTLLSELVGIIAAHDRLHIQQLLQDLKNTTG